MKDFQTKSGRMTKKKPEADFNLADSDDFFGFDGNESDSVGETVWVIASLLLALLAGFYIYQALTFIF